MPVFLTPTRTRVRAVALWLALSGVLLRGLIPAGFMPGWTQAEADGSRSWLTVCPAGELQALLPHAHHHHGGGEHTSHRIGEAHLGCPFAGASGPALPATLTLPALIAGPNLFSPGATPDSFIADFLRRLPPARGPPRQRIVG